MVYVARTWRAIRKYLIGKQATNHPLLDVNFILDALIALALLAQLFLMFNFLSKDRALDRSNLVRGPRAQPPSE